MSERDDGGPAFPIAEFDYQTMRPKNVDDMKRMLSGMSLRDYLAAHATEGDISNHLEGPWCDQVVDVGGGKQIVKGPLRRTREQARYAFADAMLKARVA